MGWAAGPNQDREITFVNGWVSPTGKVGYGPEIRFPVDQYDHGFRIVRVRTRAHARRAWTDAGGYRFVRITDQREGWTRELRYNHRGQLTYDTGKQYRPTGGPIQLRRASQAEMETVTYA